MAKTYRVVVDKGICQGHSVCVAHAPEVFRTLDMGGPYPIVDLITDAHAVFVNFARARVENDLHAQRLQFS